MELKDYTTGLHHVGIPTGNIVASVAFYESLGFEIVHDTFLDDKYRVVYLEKNGHMVETYETDDPAGVTGSINHITVGVTDIDAAFELAKEMGYKVTTGDEVIFLPFWDKGIRLVMLEGPSNELVELMQRL